MMVWIEITVAVLKGLYLLQFVQVVYNYTLFPLLFYKMELKSFDYLGSFLHLSPSLTLNWMLLEIYLQFLG